VLWPSLSFAHQPSHWFKDQFAQATQTRDPILELVSDIRNVVDVWHQLRRLGTERVKEEFWLGWTQPTDLPVCLHGCLQGDTYQHLS
jgi:hypothetical protein